MKSQQFGVLNSLEKQIISFFECYQLCISQFVFNFFHSLKERVKRQPGVPPPKYKCKL